MLSTLDRYLLRSLLLNYLTTLTVMLSLYVVLDLFVNMDEFTESGPSLGTLLLNVTSYYVPNLLLYFAQLSGAITLFACLATIARARRQNELTAMLASGVSLYRVAAPVIAFGVATTVLLVIDTEWMIPSVAHRLARDHEDADGRRTYEVLFMPDRNGSLLSAGQFNPGSDELHRMLVLWRNEQGSIVRTLEADRAAWSPPSPGRPVGRWLLDRGRAILRQKAVTEGLGPTESIEVGVVHEYESDLDPKAIQLRQSEGWVRFLSLGQLDRLQSTGTANRNAILHTRHARITEPLVAVTLLLLGIPFFLDRSPGNILNDAGRCLAVCGLCYAASFVATSIRPSTPSALICWLPIFLFATVAMVLMDRIRT